MLSLPRNTKASKPQFVLVVNVKRLWINEIFLRRRVRGFTLGNTVLLSDVADTNTYDHELIHAGQFKKAPFVFPFLYCFEFVKNGYRGNKYELEAYQDSKKPA